MRKDRKLYPPDMTAFLYYYASPEKPASRRTTYIKWWCCVFREWVQPLAIKWSAMDSSTFCSSNVLYPLYEKLREEGFVSEDLDRVLPTFSVNASRYHSSAVSLFINWHIYRRLQKQSVMFPRHYRNRIPFLKIFVDHYNEYHDTFYTGAHKSFYRHLSLILYWLFS